MVSIPLKFDSDTCTQASDHSAHCVAPTPITVNSSTGKKRRLQWFMFATKRFECLFTLQWPLESTLPRLIHLSHVTFIPLCGSNANHTTTNFSKAIPWWLLAQYTKVLANATQSSGNGRATTISMPFFRWCLSFSDISFGSRIRVAWLNIVRVYPRLKEYSFDVRSLLLQ